MSAGDADTPLSLELIADLHAGVLSDEDAAAVRSRLASDPDAARAFAALDMVQADLAESGTAAADEPPAEVTAAVVAALRNEPHNAEPHNEVTGSRTAASHAARPPRSPLRTVGVVAGLLAVVVAVGVGTVALLRLPPSPAASTGESAKYITVDPPAPDMPLSDDQIVALVGAPPDFGPLGDPQRRASCLDGLGYGVGADVLGAAPVQVNGIDAVLFVLRAETPGQLAALVVPASCSAVNTGLIVDHVLDAP